MPGGAMPETAIRVPHAPGRSHSQPWPGRSCPLHYRFSCYRISSCRSSEQPGASFRAGSCLADHDPCCRHHWGRICPFGACRRDRRSHGYDRVVRADPRIAMPAEAIPPFCQTFQTFTSTARTGNAENIAQPLLARAGDLTMMLAMGHPGGKFTNTALYEVTGTGTRTDGLTHGTTLYRGPGSQRCPVV